MSELIYHIATTVDTFIADVNGECPPALFATEGDHIQDFLEQIKEYQVVLMGGNTYRFGFKYGLKPGEPAYKDIKHIIFSKTLDFVSNSKVELVKEDAVEYVKKLKGTIDGKIWLCGGAQLAGELFDHKLIDTLKLKINPTCAGEGLKLFGDSKRIAKFQLTDFKTYESGVVLTTYKIA